MSEKAIIDPDDFFPPDITPKKCIGCAHAYYVYGIEFNCDRENNGKRCRFKRKNQREIRGETKDERRRASEAAH